MADTQEQLDELEERRLKTVGIAATQFSDQSTTFDNDGLLKEIQRKKRAIRGTSGTRYAATKKGV